MKSILQWRRNSLSKLTVGAITGVSVTALVMAVAAYSQDARGPEASGSTPQPSANFVEIRSGDDAAIARNAISLL